MFAENHVVVVYATIRKRSASIMSRMRGSSNSILIILSNRWDNPFMEHWVGTWYPLIHQVLKTNASLRSIVGVSCLNTTSDPGRPSGLTYQMPSSPLQANAFKLPLACHALVGLSLEAIAQGGCSTRETSIQAKLRADLESPSLKILFKHSVRRSRAQWTDDDLRIGEISSKQVAT
ncbi:jg14914 [Pararge aegeria aegeria]|uniref:Jg14914 protein n=1 Tax=Pararge aegeria aegeria TaxID=348720 RepID=A0A8S4RBI5_9NEOP|nr:jg14914 [Pararge aegeria aegeria]